MAGLGLSATAVAAPSISRLGPASSHMVSVRFELATDERAVAREVARRAQATRAGRLMRPLSLGEVVSRFGAGAHAVAAVRRWAVAHHLSARVNGARTHVMLRGSASDMGRALRVPLARYRQSGGRAYVAAPRRLAVPRPLRQVVESVIGLHHALPSHRPTRVTVPSRAASHGLKGAAWNCATADAANVKAYSGFFPATPRGVVAPYGYLEVGASAASPPQLVVAALAGADHAPNQADFATYVAACRFDSGTAPTLTSIGSGDSGTVSLPQEAPGTMSEQAMDAAILGAVSPPNAEVAFYGSPGSADHPMADILNALIARAGRPVSAGSPPLTVVSMSLPNQEMPGYASGMAGDDKLLARLGAMGVSVLASSGDWGSQGAPANEGDGSWSCAYTGLISVNWPASSPYVTGVGGTMWSPDPATPPNPLQSEVTWREGTGCAESASGGGQSMWYPVPSWQQSKSVPGTNGRNVPDLAMLAGAPGIIRRASNQWGWSGGTSAAAPFVAAGIARLNADRLAARKHPFGFLNPMLYGLPASAFHDVTVGSNDLWGVGCCSAGTGYDMTTGLGAPLINDPSFTAVR